MFKLLKIDPITASKDLTDEIFEYCNNLIDQRVNKNKCSNGLYVCNHDWSKKTGFYDETRGDCNSCCIEHSKTDKSSFQPKETSVLQF